MPTPEPVKKVEPPKAAPVAPKKAEEPKVAEIPAEEKLSKELADKLIVFKERGNTHFKKQAYKEAIKMFSEGINAHDTAGAKIDDDTIKTAVTQLYTNRSLCFHHLN